MSTKTIKRVLEKLERTTKLSAIKTELAAVDDIREYIQILDENINRLSELENEVKMAGDDFVQKYNDMIDLAVDFAVIYEEYDAKSSNAYDLSIEAEKVNENFEILADELGIDANDNEDYVMLDQKIVTLGELTGSNTVIAYSDPYEDASKFQK
jgi:hypothetical protein